MMLRVIVAGFWVCGLALGAHAQTIYPIDRAEILVGAKFDLKVEFPGTPDVKDLKVKINGEDAAKVFGAELQVIEREDGNEHTAVWLKQVVLSAPGSFKVEVAAGNRTAEVTWEAFDTPKGRVAKNVILFIGDGLSVAHRTAARMLSKGIKEGRYGGELAMDDMPHMALVSTHGSDSIITDSANSASSYTTGHKSCVNAMGVYCSRNKSALDHPKVETISELVKRKLGLAIGVVTNTEIQDATPASMVAHTRNRRDYNDIIPMFFTVAPEVMLGGGTPNFLPASDAIGKRPDGEDYIAKFKGAGYAYTTTNTEMKAASQLPATKKLLGLYNKVNIDGALDRRILKAGTVSLYPDQPDLTDQVRSALEVLSRNEKGFVLMVESGRIDKYSHSLDWERSVYDTIMLDNAVQVAKDFAAKANDTLIIVVPDHAHPVSIVGVYDDAAPGDSLRDKLQTYDKAKFPSYFPADSEGYPPMIDVSRRLAFVFAAYPDHCDAGRPYIDGENQPTTPGPDGKTNLANEANCKPQATRKFGNLPLGAPSGVHSADDVILTAMGPGAEQFRGRIDNTRVFRAMAIALGLGTSAKP